MTFSPIIATYTVDCPEHPVLPDYQPRATAACEAGNTRAASRNFPDWEIKVRREVKNNA